MPSGKQADFKWTGYRNNLWKWQVTNPVFKVYSTDKLANQRFIWIKVWNTLSVIAMAWGICFFSLCCHSTQAPFPDLQELIILWSDKGNIRGYSVLPKSRGALGGEKLNFNYCLFLPRLHKEWESKAKGKLGPPEAQCWAHTAVPLPFLSHCSSLPGSRPRCKTLHCSPRHPQVLLVSSSTSHTPPTRLIGSLLYVGPVCNKVCRLSTFLAHPLGDV